MWIGDVVASHSAHPAVVLILPDSAASVERVAAGLRPTWAPVHPWCPGENVSRREMYQMGLCVARLTDTVVVPRQ